MSQYISISHPQMSDFMETLGFRELSVIERSHNTRRMVRERVYERRLGEGRIRVYSSVVGPTGRKVGRDAIRVQYWVDDVKVYGTTRVHRVVNWRRNLLQRIYQLEDMVKDGALRQVPRDSTGRPMVVRKARNTGKPFWGSSSYPLNKETRRFATETFASAIVVSNKPRGIVERVMMNHWLIEQARIESAIQDLENAVRLGLITEDEIVDQLMRLTEYHAEEEIVYAWPGDLPTEAWEYALAEGHGKQYLDGVFGWVREGQEVQWHDPDVDNRDPTRLWIISGYLDLWEQFKNEAVKSESLVDIGGFMVLLQSKDGLSEAEVHVDEITPWFEPPPLYGSFAKQCMGCGVLDLYAYDLHRTKRPAYIDEDGEGQSIGTVLSCMFCEQLPDDVWITNLEFVEVLGVD